MTVEVDLTAATKALSPKQIVSVVEAEARINIWEGSVRSGKTIGSLLKWLIYVAKAPRGGELIMFGKTRDSVARNVFGPLQNPDLFGKLASQVDYTPGAPTARILDRTVHVMGANDAKAEPKVRGMTCAGAYGDELTVIDRDFFKQVLARLSVPGAQLFGTTNPDGPAHWLRTDFLLRAGELNLRSWHFTLDDNPHLDADYVRSLKAEYMGLWHRRFILGHWVAAEGAVYDMWDEDRHVVRELPTILEWIVVGIDYGTTNPFHAILIGLGVDGRLYAAREWRYCSRTARRSLTDAEYSERLRGWLGTLDNGAPLHPNRVVVDPSAASFIVQLHRDGITPTPAANSVLDGIRLQASLLATDLFRVHESCKHLIAEFPGYSWDDEATQKGEDSPIQVANHGLDGTRYGLYTTQSDWLHQLRSPLHEAA
ncbi:MAG: PBSX family phage terminase large subunit [Pseudonocardiaceae bacterium]